MENEANNLSHQARGYFLQQGQSINRLHNLLSSDLLIHHLSKWLSVLLEICLYVAFACLVIGAICIPTDLTEYAQLQMHRADPNIFDTDMFTNNDFYLAIYNRDFSSIVYAAKSLIVLIALTFMLLARLLVRNRRKSKLIRKAFTEVKEMKKSFEEAITTLKL